MNNKQHLFPFLVFLPTKFSSANVHFGGQPSKKFPLNKKKPKHTPHRRRLSARLGPARQEQPRVLVPPPSHVHPLAHPLAQRGAQPLKAGLHDAVDAVHGGVGDVAGELARELVLLPPRGTSWRINFFISRRARVWRKT